MPKLYSSKQIEKVLKKFNFTLVSQKGSHGKFKNQTGKTAILPMNKKEIPTGTFKSILKQAGLEQREFEDNV
jgi:predicted RNA binding protein YcfA (HicA-like mRNA interferase family)